MSTLPRYFYRCSSIFVIVFLLLSLASCGGGSSSPDRVVENIGSDVGADSSGDVMYSVGGSVNGLSGSLVLNNNGGDSLTITSDANFVFSTVLSDGDGYNVIVAIQPDNQTCTVNNGTGTVVNSNIDNISVNCVNNTGTGVVSEKGWTSIAQVDSGVSDIANLAQISMDSNGNALAVWVVTYTEGTSIWANRYDAIAGSWGTAIEIESGNIGYASEPKVAMDDNGNGLAVWVYWDRTSVTSIHASRYDSVAGTWGTPVPIETYTSGNVSWPDIAVDGKGNGMVIWEQYSNNSLPKGIWVNRYDAETNMWGAAEHIEGSASAMYPKIALNQVGDGIAVWSELDTNTNHFDVWASHYDSLTGLWTKSILVEDSGRLDASYPQVAIDNNGNGIVVWQQSIEYGVLSNAIAARYDAASGVWGPNILIEAGTENALVPQIAIDSNGNGLAIWMQAVDSTFKEIWSNRYDSVTNTWETATVVATSTRGVSHPRLAIDDKGNGVAIWLQFQRIGYRDDLWASRYDVSTGKWDAATLLESEVGSVDNHQIALSSNGDGIAVWDQQTLSGTTSSVNIWANHLR